jgi:hypothetical protein
MGLSMAAIRQDQLPPADATRLPRFPPMVARLGRLAVDRRYQDGASAELVRVTCFACQGTNRAMSSVWES